MLAARVPTAISRQDLSKWAENRPEAPPAPARGYWEELLDGEVVTYAAVSFFYALGQSLYDIFQSQQARAASAHLLEWWGGGDDGYAAAYAYAILVSAYALAKAVASPYVGDLSDRFGRTRVLVATLLCTAACLLACGRAERYGAVFACRLLTGVVANGGLLTARATDVAATHAQRTRLFALFTTSWAVARVTAAAVVRYFHTKIGSTCALAALCECVAGGIAAATFVAGKDKDRAGACARSARGGASACARF